MIRQCLLTKLLYLQRITRLNFTIRVWTGVESATDEDRLCLRETVQLNLAIVELDRIIDRDVVAERLGVFDRLHDYLQFVSRGQAQFLVGADVGLLVSLRLDQTVLRLLQRCDL